MADQEVPGTDELFGLIGGDEPPIDEFKMLQNVF